MSEDVVLKEKHGYVTVLSLNYLPYNLMNETLLVPLMAAMREAVETGSRAIVLRSNLRHFCAGADVDQFKGLIQAAKGLQPGGEAVSAGKAMTPLMS